MTREEAIDQLSRSGRGLHAMQVLLNWLDDDGVGLDELNQVAVVALLRAVWQRPGSTRDLIRDAISGVPQ
jgi:hypothetical protein